MFFTTGKPEVLKVVGTFVRERWLLHLFPGITVTLNRLTVLVSRFLLSALNVQVVRLGSQDKVFLIRPSFFVGLSGAPSLNLPQRSKVRA